MKVHGSFTCVGITTAGHKMFYMYRMLLALHIPNKNLLSFLSSFQFYREQCFPHMRI